MNLLVIAMLFQGIGLVLAWAVIWHLLLSVDKLKQCLEAEDRIAEHCMDKLVDKYADKAKSQTEASAKRMEERADWRETHAV